ncbi:MAG: hypothetical protein ACRC2S_02810 [Waterburya sp.]
MIIKTRSLDRACACEAAEGIAVVDLAALGIAYPKGNRATAR